MSEQAINQSLEELYNGVANVISRRTNQVIRTIGNSRLTISDVLAKYEKDGKIPTSEIPNVLKELEALDEILYRDMRTAIRTSVKDIAEYSTESLSELIIAAIGVSALAAFIGVSEADLLTNQALFSMIIGMGVTDFITSVVTSTFNRVGEDGNNLNDRIRALARILSDEIRNTLRKNIIKGEVNAVTIRELDRVINEYGWRVGTIVDTESFFSARQSVAKFAELSGIVAGLKIIDFPHGKPGEHERHKCFIYAHTDEHGMGRGVYPVTTRKIRNPHPQCRSILTYVMIDEFK